MMSAAQVRTLDGSYASLGQAELRRIQARLDGELLLPGSDAYEDARRIWNGMIDKRPGLVVRCRGAADVAGRDASPGRATNRRLYIRAATKNMYDVSVQAGAGQEREHRSAGKRMPVFQGEARCMDALGYRPPSGRVLRIETGRRRVAVR